MDSNLLSSGKRKLPNIWHLDRHTNTGYKDISFSKAHELQDSSHRLSPDTE